MKILRTRPTYTPITIVFDDETEATALLRLMLKARGSAHITSSAEQTVVDDLCAKLSTAELNYKSQDSEKTQMLNDLRWCLNTHKLTGLLMEWVESGKIK